MGQAEERGQLPNCESLGVWQINQAVSFLRLLAEHGIGRCLVNDISLVPCVSLSS